MMDVWVLHERKGVIRNTIDHFDTKEAAERAMAELSEIDVDGLYFVNKLIVQRSIKEIADAR